MKNDKKEAENETENFPFLSEYFLYVLTWNKKKYTPLVGDRSVWTDAVYATLRS